MFLLRSSGEGNIDDNVYVEGNMTEMFSRSRDSC